MSRSAVPLRGQSTGAKMNNFMNKEAQKYLNPGGIADSVASFDVETDSVLTAVDIGKPNAGIDIAPAVCTMDFIGCIIDGKWTVIDLEQADMKDDKNLLFVYNDKLYRVETCNIVLQYSRGHPSMTALNAAFNDDEENDGATIDTEMSTGLRNAGIDKYKIQRNDTGQLSGLMSGDSDPDDEDTVNSGGDLANNTANLKIGNLAPKIVGSDGSNAPVIDARNVMNGYDGYNPCPDARAHQTQMQQQIQQQQQQYQQNQQIQQQKHQQYQAAQKQQQYIHEQYAKQQQLRQEQQQKFEEQRRQEQEMLIEEQKRQEVERLQKEYEKKLEEQRRQEQDKLRQRYEKELEEHRRQEHERQRKEQEFLQKKYEQELADQKKKEQERLRNIMIEQKQKQQQEQLRKQQEAEKEMKRIEELKLEKRRLELQKQEQQKQELQRQELQRAEQKHLQEEQRRQILEQQRQEQEYLQQQEQLRQQEVMRAQKEVERQQRELEKRRMEKERVEREARERAEWLEHQHKLEMQKIETQRAELQRKERERQLRLKQIDDERVAREKQELERQDTQRQQILAEQQKQLLQKYQGVSPGSYVTPTQQSIAEKAEKLKQVAAYFSQQKYNLTHGAVPSSPPRSFMGAPGSFPMIAIPKLYQSPFGAQQAALAPAPAPGFHGSPKLQMPGANHSPGFFNSPGMTSIGSSPRQNFGNTYSHFPNPFNNPQQFQQPALQQSCHYRANQFNSFGQYNPQAFQATVGFCTTKEEAEPKLKEPELKDKPAMIEAIPQADLNPKECLPTEEEQVEEEAVSTSRVHIDGEWFKVPTAAVKDVNDGYCEVNFNGDKVKVEKAKVEKVKVEKACVVDGDVDVEQIVGKYEVFANKKWNIVQANNITPSKKQPGTYIVKLNERCIRVNPECLRLINEKPFREARDLLEEEDADLNEVNPLLEVILRGLSRNRMNSLMSNQGTTSEKSEKGLNQHQKSVEQTRRDIHYEKGQHPNPGAVTLGKDSYQKSQGYKVNEHAPNEPLYPSSLFEEDEDLGDTSLGSYMATDISSSAASSPAPSTASSVMENTIIEDLDYANSDCPLDRLGDAAKEGSDGYSSKDFATPTIRHDSIGIIRKLMERRRQSEVHHDVTDDETDEEGDTIVDNVENRIHSAKKSGNKLRKNAKVTLNVKRVPSVKGRTATPLRSQKMEGRQVVLPRILHQPKTFQIYKNTVPETFTDQIGSTSARDATNISNFSKKYPAENSISSIGKRTRKDFIKSNIESIRGMRKNAVPEETSYSSYGSDDSKKYMYEVRYKGDVLTVPTTCIRLPPRASSFYWVKIDNIWEKVDRNSVKKKPQMNGSAKLFKPPRCVGQEEAWVYRTKINAKTMTFHAQDVRLCPRDSCNYIIHYNGEWLQIDAWSVVKLHRSTISQNTAVLKSVDHAPRPQQPYKCSFSLRS